MSNDLSHLTREQKLEMIEMIREKKRRLRSRRAIYKPNEGQLPVHKSEKTIRVVTSSNAAGKTCMAVHEAVWACLGFNPITNKTTRVPAKVVVLLDRPDKVADVWLPEIRKWFEVEEDQLHKNGKPYVSEIQFSNGSSLQFYFQLMEPMAFESIELDFMVADEPFSRNIWIALLRGGRKKFSNPKYLLIGTPLAGSWVRKELIDPWSRGESTDTECFKFGIWVNQKNLAEGYIERFSAHMSEKERRIRLHGEFFDLEGLALAHLFDRSVHVLPPFQWPQDNPVVCAIDFHPHKSHTAILLGCDRYGYLYYIKELTSREVPRDLAEELKAFYKGYRVIDIVCDSLGNSELTGGDGNKSFIQVLNDHGVRVRATSFNDKKDAPWIERIQSVLSIPNIPNQLGQKIPQLRIFEGNRGIIGNIEHVQWLKFKNHDEFKPTLDISDKDYLSCLKYALACNLRYNRRSDKVIRTKGPVGWSRR